MARPIFVAFALSIALIALPVHAGQHKRAVTVPAAKQVTRASWYGQSFRGRRTASGALFNPKKLTAAHRTLHIGSKVRVTELRSGRSVIVQITDRGPYFPGRGIDLSYAAAKELGIVNKGVARVQVEVLPNDEPPAEAPIVTAFAWPKPPWLPKAIVE